VTSRVLKSSFLTRSAPSSVSTNSVLVVGNNAVASGVASRLKEEGLDVLTAQRLISRVDRSGHSLNSLSAFTEITGFEGDFRVDFFCEDAHERQNVGFVVMAESAELVPKFEQYRLSPCPPVIALSDLQQYESATEIKLLRKTEWLHVAFLCGLDGASDPWTFSRVLEGIENIGKHEKVQCYVFGKHFMVASEGLERRYRNARQNGAIFFKFDGEIPCFTSTGEGIAVRFSDSLLGIELELLPDLLVVDETPTPNSPSNSLIETMPVACLFEPFLKPDSMRFPSVRTPKAGIFCVGPVGGSFHPDDQQIDVEAVVLAIKQRISLSDQGSISNFSAYVDVSKCSLCLTCLRLCPHGAISFHDRASINSSSCAGCGICASECPMKAIVMIPPPGGEEFETQFLRACDRAAEEKKILALLCSRSASQAWNLVNVESRKLAVSVVVTCAGSVQSSYLLDAIRKGAPAVIAAGCFQGNCASIYGNVLAAERSVDVSLALKEAGYDPGIIRFVSSAGNTPLILEKAITEMWSLTR
jgi:quinone-modifying oxidoreductase, subunit QmoB